MTLSILIPVYNEEPNISNLFERLTGISWPFEVEFVFVDYGSRDNSYSLITEEVAKRKNSKFRFVVYQ
jgi:glycosyltransferase involved in cell wall biosynthesis